MSDWKYFLRHKPEKKHGIMFYVFVAVGIIAVAAGIIVCIKKCIDSGCCARFFGCDDYDDDFDDMDDDDDDCCDKTDENGCPVTGDKDFAN